MVDTLRVAILEPYYGGSHAAFVDTLVAHSRYRCTLVTLPARKWKWRMRGAAIWFAQNSDKWLSDHNGRAVDLILCNDMLSIADLRALLPAEARSVAIACYFHENQLTYPIPNESDRDYQYGMTNITSCLAADAVWFNSRFHRDDFLAAAAKLLRRMPDYVPERMIESIAEKAVVLPPPITVQPLGRRERSPGEPLTILWCHRWEYDKNPEPFFAALQRLDEAGYPFRLVLLGEQFRTAPNAFAQACARLRSHIVHTGFVPDRTDYVDALSECDVVVSSAIQENFGIAVAEAILSGCQPLLPNRVAYPELITPALHPRCLYDGDDKLFEHLERLFDGTGLLTSSDMSTLQDWVFTRFGRESAVAAIDEAMFRLTNRTEQAKTAAKAPHPNVP